MIEINPYAQEIVYTPDEYITELTSEIEKTQNKLEYLQKELADFKAAREAE